MRLAKAKAYALEMVKGIWDGRTVKDQIANLNRLHVHANEPMPTLAEVRAQRSPWRSPRRSRRWSLSRLG